MAKLRQATLQLIDAQLQLADLGQQPRTRRRTTRPTELAGEIGVNHLHALTLPRRHMARVHAVALRQLRSAGLLAQGGQGHLARE